MHGDLRMLSENLHPPFLAYDHTIFAWMFEVILSNL